MTSTPLPSPIILPGTGQLPLLLSVPHSGTHYPEWLLRDTRRGKASLEPLEDPLVDRLVWRAVARGCGAVIARAPRAAVDCNRSPKEIDPATAGIAPGDDPGPRARGGLGIVPTRLPREGELWQRKLSRLDIERRMAGGWRPYHAALRAQLGELHRCHPEVLLLDCHSMPARGGRQPEIVIGDRFGRSAAGWLGDLARSTIERSGFTTAFNDPYAGGWIVESSGDPAEGLHALQLEFDRGLYLDERSREAGPGFDHLAHLLDTLVVTLGQALLERQAIPDAAE